jgi:ABC-type branched-subunit amino acid transport system ATPase component
VNAGDVVLTTEALRVGYGSYVVLHDVNFTAYAGQIVSLVGLNGAGKSSLLKTLLGTIAAIDGRISLLGAEVTNWPTFRRVAAGIGFSPEGRRVFPNMTLTQNMLLVEEPSQGLAPVVVDRVYEALVGVLPEGVAVVVAEQFQQVREDVSDRVLVIDGGTVTRHRSGPDVSLTGRQI